MIYYPLGTVHAQNLSVEFIRQLIFGFAALTKLGRTFDLLNPLLVAGFIKVFNKVAKSGKKW